MRVKFLIDFDMHRDGDVADLPDVIARVLVEGQVAEKADSPADRRHGRRAGGALQGRVAREPVATDALPAGRLHPGG